MDAAHPLRFVVAAFSCLAVLSLGACDGDPLDQGRPSLLNLDGRAEGLGLTVLPDGRALVVGDVGPAADPKAPTSGLLVRYSPVGRVDPLFGMGGTTITAGTVVTAAGPANASVIVAGYGVAVDGSGRILVTGRYWAGGHGDKFLLARYSQDGALDTTFGAAGVVGIDANPHTAFNAESSGEARAVIVQPDGKILLGGYTAVNHAMSGSVWSDYAIVRLHPDGTLDDSFGHGGAVVLSFGDSSFVEAMTLLPDGRILAAGYAAPKMGYDVALLRLLSDGRPDPSFGNAGVFTADLGASERIFSLAVDGGRHAYVVAGQSSTDAQGKASRFLLARVTEAGALDTGLNGTGFVVTDFPDGVSSARGVMLSGVDYLVAGFAMGPQGNFDFAFASYDATGRITDCAGDGGRLVFPASTADDDVINAMAPAPDGAPVVVGRSGTHLVYDRLPSLTCATRTAVQ